MSVERGGLLEELRAATLDEHERVERLAVATGFLQDDGAYHRYLRAMYGFVVVAEALLSSAPEARRWLRDLDDRRKVHLLEADLRALGDTPATVGTLPRIEGLGAPSSAAAMLGVAYVLEGATLGGRYITSRLSPSIPRVARSFFAGYGPRTGAMWRAFCVSLTMFEATASVDERATTLASARATFAGLGAWLDRGRSA